MAADLSKLSLRIVTDPNAPGADPTGNGEPTVCVFYTDDTGEFLLGLNVNLHGGRLRGIRSNPSPSDRRDELIVQDDAGRLDIAG